LLNKWGKYPFASSFRPKVLGKSANLIGIKLNESMNLILSIGMYIERIFAPRMITSGITPFSGAGTVG
jgi:hypothetical protein